MALHYSVTHAFGHKGKLYTRANATEINKLPREVRDRQMELGHITEYDDRAGDPAAPAAPATTASKGK